MQNLQSKHPVLTLLQQLGSAVSRGGCCEGVKSAILLAAGLVREGWSLTATPCPLSNSNSGLPLSLVLRTFAQCLDECLDYLAQLSVTQTSTEERESPLLTFVAATSLHASLAHFAYRPSSLPQLAKLVVRAVNEVGPNGAVTRVHTLHIAATNTTSLADEWRLFHGVLLTVSTDCHLLHYALQRFTTSPQNTFAWGPDVRLLLTNAPLSSLTCSNMSSHSLIAALASSSLPSSTPPAILLSVQPLSEHDFLRLLEFRILALHVEAQELERVAHYVNVKVVDNWLSDDVAEHVARLDSVTLELCKTFAVTPHLLAVATSSPSSRQHVTLVLRSSAAPSGLSDLFRAIRKALWSVSAVMWGGSGVLPGGGATELALATHLLSTPCPTSQLRLIREGFARALQSVVISLLTNCGSSDVATDFVRLQAAQRDGKRWGVVVSPAGTISCRDPLDVASEQELGVAEVAEQRANVLRLVTYTALAILRIDHFFVSSK